MNGNGGPIRVVIVENHQLVSESLGLLLDGQRDMQVVGKATSVGEAGALPPHLSPDVVVMDFHLDDGTGHDAALAMRDSFPNARFVFLSRDDSDDARLAAVEAGASAYLHKSSAASEVIASIRKVAQGMSLITPTMIAKLVSKGKDREHMRESLSPREREVLQLIADGVGTRRIAQQLGVSYSTVRTHLRSISAKLGTHSLVNTVVTARELELVRSCAHGRPGSVEERTHPESEQVRVGFQRPQERQAIESAHVVLADDHDRIAPAHDLERLLVAEHLFLGAEHASFRHHLPDDPNHRWSLRQCVGEPALPLRDGLRCCAALEPHHGEEPAVEGAPQVDVCAVAKGIGVPLQLGIGRHQHARLAKSQTVGEERRRQPHAAGVGAVQGGQVPGNRDRAASHVHRVGSRRGGCGLLHEGLKV